MRQRVVPLLVPPPRRARSGDVGCYETKARGMTVLTAPLLNKGTAFTAEEREALGLTGLLPPVISTLEAQVTCAYAQYQRLPDALSKNIYLTALHDRNEVLFFRLLSENLREMIPIVNDRTVPSRVPPTSRRIPLDRPRRRDGGCPRKSRSRTLRYRPDSGYGR